MKILLTLVFVLGVGVGAQAQTTGPVGSRLAWDQAGPSLSIVQGYVYRTSFNGGSFTVDAATCTGASSPFACSVDIPLQAGSHTARVSAAQIVNGQQSPQAISVIFNFTLTPGAPNAPGGLRLEPPQGAQVAGTVLRRFPWAGMDVAETMLDEGVLFYIGTPIGLQKGSYSVQAGDRLHLAMNHPEE